MIGLHSACRPLTTKTGSTKKGTFDRTCSKNILIFAKGTFEPGQLGVFIEPMFMSWLPEEMENGGG